MPEPELIQPEEFIEQIKMAKKWAMMVAPTRDALELVVINDNELKRYISPNLVAMEHFEYTIFMNKIKIIQTEADYRRIL